MVTGDRDIIGLHPGVVLVTHGPDACAGQWCCVHNPSRHRLTTAPLHWRSDRRLMERICEHGVGHPDPDDLAHHERRAGAAASAHRGVHGCDGCCGEIRE